MACPRAGQPAGYLNRAIRPAAPRGPASRGRHFLLATNSFAGLPVKPQSELDEPRVTVAVAADCAHGGRGHRTALELNVAQRQVELWMVEEVEEVGAELYPAALSNGETLHYSEVHVRLPGTFEQIARDVAWMAAERVVRVPVVRGQARYAGSPVGPVGELVEPAIIE